METINVFGKTYKVSKQAKYSYYSSIIIVSTILLSIYRSKSKFNSKELLPQFIIIITACIVPYATNCVSTGQKCEEYGWYLSISNIILAALLLFSFLKTAK